MVEPPSDEPSPSDDLQSLNIKSEPMSVVDAVYSLDPTLDHHWTKTGLPNLSEVGKLRDLHDTTRAEVEEVTKGYRRPKQEA